MQLRFFCILFIVIPAAEAAPSRYLGSELRDRADGTGEDESAEFHSQPFENTDDTNNQAAWAFLERDA